MLTNTRRIIRSGLLSFWRNGFVSLASILVTTITLFVIGSLLFFNAIMANTLDQLRSQVDINAYFVEGASETDILAVKVALEGLPEIESVQYTSRDQALANFRERHANDELMLQALEELEENPLLASLNIMATDPSHYGSITQHLEHIARQQSGGVGMINNVTYDDPRAQEAIERLNTIIDGAQKTGYAIALTLVFITIIVTFNTIRLAIYTAREEIGVMRLVGADNKFIRGPFLVEGAIYGLCSALIALAFFYPLTMWLADRATGFYSGMNLHTYYMQNFPEIAFIILSVGVVLGVFSSYLAIRKYLTKKYLRSE
jgi:cell division transport system permease protein